MAFSFADLVELVQFVHPKDIPRLYINWWWNLWLEEPVHLLVETLLLFALFWFVIVKRKPAKGIPLKEQEKEELILEWTPEPLVPEPDANKVSSLEPPVISKQTPTQVEINGNMVFNLASVDFLGLAGHPDVKETALSTL
jgi:serine palmitoyltransferase